MLTRPLLRKAFAALGVLVAFVLGYLGLGWAVRSGVLRGVLGERIHTRLYEAYAHAAGALFPGDQDGDGVCDGYELFWKTDPRKADAFPFRARWDADGFAAIDDRAYPEYARAMKSSRSGLLPEVAWETPGERRHFRARLMIGQRSGTLTLTGASTYTGTGTLGSLTTLKLAGAMSFPRGFQLRLSVKHHLFAATIDPNSAPPTLLVPVARDGSIEFDLQMPPDSPGEEVYWSQVLVDNAATGMNLGSFFLKRVWALPLLPATAHELTDQADGKIRRKDGKTKVYLVEWPLSIPVDQLRIEVARDQEGAEWFPVALRDADETRCNIWLLTDDPLHPYSGPLKFRVVPYNNQPPEK